MTHLLYRQITEGCFAETIGDGGLEAGPYGVLLGATGEGIDELRRRRADGSLPLLELADARDDLDAVGAVAARLSDAASDVLVLGTGGSSLGGQALAALAGRLPGPRLHFLDNIDGDSFAALLAGLDLGDVAVLAISKSGGTLETLAQTAICLATLERTLGTRAVGGRVAMIAEPGDNPLRRLAGRYGAAVIDHHPRIGGRYSVLSAVGLLPALIAGLDVAAVRAGAARALEASLSVDDPAQSPAAVGAALTIGLARHRGASVHVLMPYADALERFAMWHRQLWAESLGKDGAGTTPVTALGPVDQHSQLQLYLEGPADKMFTLLLTRAAGQGPQIGDPGIDDERLKLLAGRSVGDLVAAHQEATAETLVRRGRPTRIFRLERVDEATLGALFMHFMLETILAAGLLGVDPFDQPAVEEGKILARRYLSGGPA